MEIWKPIKNFETLYEVSNQGNVRSIQNNIILKPLTNKKGYFFIVCCNKGIRKIHYIHKLVALYFIPNPHKKEQVNHIDENKSNNRVNNLEWNTQSENIRHSKSKPIFCKNLFTLEIHKFNTFREASDFTKISPGNIHRNLKGKTKAEKGFIFFY